MVIRLNWLDELYMILLTRCLPCELHISLTTPNCCFWEPPLYAANVGNCTWINAEKLLWIQKILRHLQFWIRYEHNICNIKKKKDPDTRNWMSITLWSDSPHGSLTYTGASKRQAGVQRLFCCCYCRFSSFFCCLLMNSLSAPAGLIRMDYSSLLYFSLHPWRENYLPVCPGSAKGLTIQVLFLSLSFSSSVSPSLPLID